MSINFTMNLSLGNRGEVHPAQCESILRSARLALVEIIGARNTPPERAPHRGAAQVDALGDAEFEDENGQT